MTTIHGVLLFRPLPKHLDQNAIENALDPAKDVDCMTDGSMSGVFTGKERRLPALYTPGMYGDPGSLRNRLHRQESRCGRPFSGSWKTGCYDAGQEERYRNHLPHQDC